MFKLLKSMTHRNINHVPRPNLTKQTRRSTTAQVEKVEWTYVDLAPGEKRLSHQRLILHAIMQTVNIYIYIYIYINITSI